MRQVCKFVVVGNSNVLPLGDQGAITVIPPRPFCAGFVLTALSTLILSGLESD